MSPASVFVTPAGEVCRGLRSALLRIPPVRGLFKPAAQSSSYLSYIIFYLLSVLLPVSCASGGSLNPAKSYAEKKFNKDQYLSATGYGKAPAEAEQNALANLISIFEQSVKSRLSVTEIYSENSDGKKNSPVRSVNSNQTVESSSSAGLLTGAETADTWFDGKNYCSTAVMDRQKCSAIYGNKLNGNLKLIENALKTADSKSSIRAAGLYYFAAKLAGENRAYADIIAVLSGRGFTGNQEIKSAAFYELEAKRIANGITIGIETGDIQADGGAGGYEKRIGNAFSGVFNSLGFITESAGSKRPDYILKADFYLKPEPASDRYDNKYASYRMDAVLTGKDTGRTIFTFSKSGREGHLTLEQAEERAVRDAVQKIQTEYRDAFLDFISK